MHGAPIAYCSDKIYRNRGVVHAPLPFNRVMRVRFSVPFQMQLWISVNEAFPVFYLTRYIKYINICCVTKL